ncbi:unnamed protein product [Cylindrotheca closterium]|uniref:Uncharacterized protein n=1 Tax=Cylindrotheca closterium TaxID=2856 RepID=A0AAD2JNJ8_9STRA|nr:unnamed protein product [Cylindrotheca closterium]
MVFLTASKRITSLIGSPLLRLGLAARNSKLFSPLVGGEGSSSSSSSSSSSLQSISLQQKQLDTPYLDMALLIPFAQKLLSLALYDESQKRVSQHYSSTGKDGSILKSLYQGQQKQSSPSDGDASVATATKELSNLRVQSYDHVIRKSLLPKETHSNLQSWMGHLRILKWARAEFLISKYGPMVKEAMDAYPQLRGSPQFQRNPNQNFFLQLARGRLVLPFSQSTSSSSSSPSQEDEADHANKTSNSMMLLPTTDTVVKAFDMKDWAIQKDSQGLHESTNVILDKLSSSSQIIDQQQATTTTTTTNNSDDTAASMEDISTEELLHCLSGGHVQYCGPLNAICEEANLYQLWTKEYVQHLGDYLLQEYSSNTDKTTIVDIGAGDGLLIRYLQEYMGGKLRKGNRRKHKNAITGAALPRMVSTDDGSWGIFAKAKVEKLNVEEALEKYGKLSQDEHLVVLCSWMPQQVDWTAQFRESKVDEYILIGEADDGSCGHGWDTWGNYTFAPSESDIPPFQQDGYQRWDMDSLIPFQFSRFDSAISRSSKTVSFRRKRSSTKKQKQ